MHVKIKMLVKILKKLAEKELRIHGVTELNIWLYYYAVGFLVIEFTVPYLYLHVSHSPPECEQKRHPRVIILLIHVDLFSVV